MPQSFFVVQGLKFCIQQNNLLETLHRSLIKISRGIDGMHTTDLDFQEDFATGSVYLTVQFISTSRATRT